MPVLNCLDTDFLFVLNNGPKSYKEVYPLASSWSCRRIGLALPKAGNQALLNIIRESEAGEPLLWSPTNALRRLC